MDVEGLFFKIGADLTEFSNKMNEAMGEIGGMSGKLAGVGSALTGALTVPLTAIGGAAFAAAAALDGAFDGIRTKTGQTGENLDQLKESFRNVFANVPDAADTVSQAIGELNARTGQMGPGLEQLAKQTLDLARVTGEQLGPMIGATTRLFGDWSVEISKQAPAMDTLYKVAQMTGTSVTTLAEKMVYAGAPLRQLGFDMDTAAVMIGKFEKEGVNTEIVLGAMKTALGKFGAAGKEPVEAFKQLVEGIKNSDVATGNLMAKQATNVKVFADFAAAVREGRLDLDEMTKTMQTSKETIAASVADTQDFAEAWSIFKNKLMLALEPLGGILFNALNTLTTLMEPALGVVMAMGKAFAELSPTTQTVVVAIAALAAAAGPVLVAFGAMAASISAISAAIGILMGPAFLAGALVAIKAVAIAAAAAAAAFLAWKIGEWLYQFGPVKTVIDAIGSAISSMLGWIAKLPGVSSVVSAMSGAWDSVKNAIGGATSKISDASRTMSSTTPVMAAVGQSAQAAGAHIAAVGGHLENTSKQGAAAAKQLQQHLDSAWKSIQGFLLDMPKTFEQASKMIANGFNIDGAIKKTVDEMQKLQLEFGTKMPAAAQQMYAALNINLLQLKAFQAQTENIKLELAFQRASDAVTAYGTSATTILKAQAAVIKEVMDLSMAGASKAMAEVQALDGAFKSLGVTWSGELASKAAKAADAYNLIVDAQKRGAASAVDALRAQSALLTAQIALAKNTGDSYIELEARLKQVNAELVILGAETDKTATKTTAANKQIVQGASEMEKSWKAFGQQVSTVFTDFGKDIANSILHAKNFGEAFTKAAGAIKDAFMRLVVEGAIKQMMLGLDGVSNMLGGLGKQLSSLLGGFGFGGSGGGAGGGNGGGGGGVGGGGGLGSLGGGVNLITGITTAITGVLSYVQGRHMEKDIASMEVTTRGVLNQLIGIQGTMNKWLPLLEHNVQLVRLEGIEQGIMNLSAGGGMSALVDGLQQIFTGMNVTLQTGFGGLISRIDLLTEVVRLNLRGLIDITSTTYGLLLKPGSTPQYNLTTPTQGGQQGSQQNTQRPLTVQVQQTNSTDSYRQGLLIGQGILSVTGARI